MRLATATLLLAALATDCAFAQEKVESKDDPKSDNAGKILGKWKMLEEAGKSTNLAEVGLYSYFEFKKSGQFVLGFGAEDAKGEELLKTGKVPNHVAKYKLLANDGVELFDIPKSIILPEKAKGVMKVKVKIDGDSMTLTENDKVKKLVRLKEPKKDDAKDKPEKK